MSCAVLGDPGHLKIFPRRPRSAPRGPKIAPRSSYQDRRQIGLRGPKIAPRCAKIAPRCPQTGPRAAKRALGTILGSSCAILEPSWDQKYMFFLAFSYTFCKSVFWPQHRFRRHLGTQEAPTWGVKSGQERPKSGQETLQRSSQGSPAGGGRRHEAAGHSGKKKSLDRSRVHRSF